MNEREKAVAAIKNSFEEHNTNQLIFETLKAANNQHKQEIACIKDELKLIEISVKYLQVEAKAMSSEKKFTISKM